MRRIFTLIILALLVFGSSVPSSGVSAQAPGPDQPTAPDDTPYPLVGSGVNQYALAAPKIFWTNGSPICPPTSPEGQSPAAPNDVEWLQRIATSGGTTRYLYSQDVLCDQGKFHSNIVADANYLYWLGPGGLFRLSTNANVGDAPQLIDSTFQQWGELAITSDRVYVLSNVWNATLNRYDMSLDYILKSDNSKHYATSYGSGFTTFNLKADGQYVYYMWNNGLYRLNPDTGVESDPLATGVTAYYPEGARLKFCTINPFKCYFSNLVYIAQNGVIKIYDNDAGTLGNAIYTSTDPTPTVAEMVTDFSNLYIIEKRAIACSPQPCFITYNYLIIRMGRGGSNPTPIYNVGPSFYTLLQHLTSDGTYLFWQELNGSNSMVQRMPGNASALPNINLKVTGMEVTQGIQNTSNSVKLIRGKRTFVRVYVQSDGPGAVSGVTARLTSRYGGTPNTISPSNSTGTSITVRTSPDRNDLNQSFLFELPTSWTNLSYLDMMVTINPFHTQLEPNYSDNTSEVIVYPDPSPTLSVEYFRLNYVIGGTTYSPRVWEDVILSESWIKRAYPIGGSIGVNYKPRIWDVAGGTQLGNWVNHADPVCSQLYGGPYDDINLCASYKTNGWLLYYRTATQFGTLNVGLKTNAFYYGMISDAAGYFPRGQAMYALTSVGPSGVSGGWDTDGSYADWYSAHEIGHSLGRAHPNAGSDNPATAGVYENCGHSRSDPGYPYGNTYTSRAPIGPSSGLMEGFDAGDAAFGIAKTVYPSSIWNDVMSYCSNQWISDYTYTGMYNYMIAHPSLAEAGMNPNVITGDLLVLSGVINPTTSTAGFSFIRRMSSAVNAPAIVAGDYSFRMLDGSDNVLSTIAFTPVVNETGNLTFAQIVDFAAGTRKLQIIRNSDSKVLTSVNVSANAPTISGVALQGAPNPVTGVVTLAWTASDPDGDPLTFDISYSRDNGATFQPAALGITGSSTTLDTASLGGSGTAILRVTASDGVNAASADSASFVMANKAPTVYILNPANNLRIHYGQLVNFEGMALDAQDGTVDDSGFVWKDSGNNTLGTGAAISLDNLPVGTNVITLAATNSVGVTGTATVTVIVDDDLSEPGPTLTAGPSPVGWHINAGTTDKQTAVVTVNNGGSGTLNWTASSDRGWLAASPITGTVTLASDPSILTLTADPAGLIAGFTYTAKVTLTNKDDTSQVIVIPVSLAIGDVMALIPTREPWRVFMPVLIR